ncbi:hypothetical protein OSB04_006610 [Centaurea solstitialis]|uniref:Integrase catalytic domain-containing protein n=1 Tax=Centaurea solstitialis TaxID=347529 RepID=A0AA38TI84_9ASTR|nr:hypothetical protein OSB04_006610 [Centaurea solstitialis]
MTGTLELLSSYIKQEGTSVAFGGNQKGKIKGHGMIVKGEVRMNQVSHVDGLKNKLICLSQLCDNGLDVMFKIKYCIMYKADTLIELIRENRRGDLYLICFESLEAREEICLVSSIKNKEAWLWHTRFCHLNFHTLDKLSLGGKKYMLVLIDEFSRFTCVEFMKKKSHVPSILINLLKRLQVLYGLQVRVLRSDNGTEFKNSITEEYLASVGITHNFSAPRTPQQNGVVERKNRTLVEAARTMCKCYVLNDQEPIGKFNPKGDDAIFIGYSCDSVAYRVYIPISPVVVVSTNVRSGDNFQVTQDKFKEELKTQAEKSPNATITNDLEQLFQEWYEDEPDPDRASASDPRASVDNSRASAENHPEESPLSTVISGPSASNTPSFVSLPPENSQPTSLPEAASIPPSTTSDQVIPTVPNHISTSHSIEEINSSINLPHATKWSKDHPLSQIIGDPSEGVKTRATANYCLFTSMQDELTDQFERNQVWTLVPLPNGKMAIGTKWVFRNKKDERDVVISNKARPVVKHPELGMNAYPLFLSQMTFTEVQQISLSFIKKHDDDILLVQIYVDDIIFGSTDVSMCKFESLVQKEFEMSMMGELNFFLGLQVKQSTEGIFINQSKYVNDLLKKYQLHDASPMRTPMAPGL